MESQVTSRPRKRCSKCGQMLSYSAYNRHKNPSVCHERTSVALPAGPHESTGPSSVREQPAESHPIVAVDSEEIEVSFASESSCEFRPDRVDYSEELSEISDEESLSDSSEADDAEIVDIYEGDSDVSLADIEEPIQPATSVRSHNPAPESGASTFVLFVCYFIGFFQTCYKLSDRAVTLLLVFLKSILMWIVTLLPSPANEVVRVILHGMPKNAYFLKKIFKKTTDSITKYVVCPKCCALYTMADLKAICSHRMALEIPKCFAQLNAYTTCKCSTALLKKVKHGDHYKLVPKRVYAYNSVKCSLAKLYSRSDFHIKCQHWMSRQSSPDLYSDIYDGNVWKAFQSVKGKPFLQQAYNLCLKLNVDWIQPFEHTQYSMGIIYLAVENLPRSERFKVENIIVVGCIPGPREPKGNINSFLKPLVDELLELWSGVQLSTDTMFGYTSVRCALSCISADIPAIRKSCGFAGHSATMGCSKCLKKFPCRAFGEKLDYSGYDRERWQYRDMDSHVSCHLAKISKAKTVTEQRVLEKQFGVRYSELLRLPYFDIVRYHCVDVMHNLLLGTAKNMLNVWKTCGLLSKEDLHSLQDKIDNIQVPPQVGRIPNKIFSNTSSLTADQWRNWTCIYSLYALRSHLSPTHYDCWVLFSQACILLLQPVISKEELEEADRKLIEFCKTFQQLYGPKKCTPNMHLHCHIKETVSDYGPVYSTWCFAFERFNGIFESFQKNWIYPEVQLLVKFINFQNVLSTVLPCCLPSELMEILQVQSSRLRELVVGQGSLLTTHVDSAVLQVYRKNTTCSISNIDATEQDYYKTPARKYEQYMSPENLKWISDVYKVLYPNQEFSHVPMKVETFYEVEVLGERLISDKTKGNYSPYISAYWAGQCGKISGENIRIGKVLYFLKHTIALQPASLPLEHSVKRQMSCHLFAKVQWQSRHPRETWFPSPILIVDPHCDAFGPATFIPLSRIVSRCAVVSDKIEFDYGEDSVLIVTPLKKRL